MESDPINISAKNVTGKCELKCAYNFSYNDSNTTVENMKIMLQFSYSSNKPPVTYNRQKYNVDKIMIVSPSVHLFNGKKTAAELLVQHTPILGGQLLNIGIPIVQSTNTTNATQILSDLIAVSAQYAPTSGSSYTLPDTISLSQLIPNLPFYSYIANETDWIVFDVLNAIPLSTDSLKQLAEIISPYRLPTPSKPLFYNSLGPNTVTINDGIYISCKPTGTSTTETSVYTSKDSSSGGGGSIDFNNPTFQLIIKILIGCILFVALFFGLNYAYTYATNTTKSSSVKSKGRSMIELSSRQT